MDWRVGSFELDICVDDSMQRLFGQIVEVSSSRLGIGGGRRQEVDLTSTCSRKQVDMVSSGSGFLFGAFNLSAFPILKCPNLCKDKEWIYRSRASGRFMAISAAIIVEANMVKLWVLGEMAISGGEF